MAMTATLQQPSAHLRKPIATAEETILSVNNIEVIYDHVILVLKGVSLAVPRGGIVALLGANGAGKTTTLKAISNLARGTGRGHQGLDRVRRCRGPAPFAARGGTPRLHPGHGGSSVLRASDDRGKPAHRRIHPPRRQGIDTARPGKGLRLFSEARRAQARACRLYVRRRTADVRARTRAHVATQDDSAR